MARKQQETKVFSFRAPTDEVAKWRLYASIHVVKIDNLGAEAMREYMQNHPLEGTELQLYNERLQKAKEEQQENTKS